MGGRSCAFDAQAQHVLSRPTSIRGTDEIEDDLKASVEGECSCVIVNDAIAERSH